MPQDDRLPFHFAKTTFYVVKRWVDLTGGGHAGEVMSKSITIICLKEKLVVAIDSENDSIAKYVGSGALANCYGETKTAELRSLAEGRKQAFEVILEALQGKQYKCAMCGKRSYNI